MLAEKAQSLCLPGLRLLLSIHSLSMVKAEVPGLVLLENTVFKNKKKNSTFGKTLRDFKKGHNWERQSPQEMLSFDQVEERI